MSPLQETGNHNPSDPDFEEWRQVNENIILLSIIRENIQYLFQICQIFGSFSNVRRTIGKYPNYA
jgi:hypothetical protein